MGLAESLDHARVSVERTLLDSCTITSDQAGTRGDVFNLATGMWERASGARGEVYSGPCNLKMLTAVVQNDNGQDVVEAHWEARITIGDSEGVAVSQTLTMDESRDDAMLAMQFLIVGVGGGTFSLSRRLLLQFTGPAVRTRAGF